MCSDWRKQKFFIPSSFLWASHCRSRALTNCIIAYNAGHTKATVPAGLLSDGEPYGLLFMGKEGGDSTLISIM